MIVRLESRVNYRKRKLNFYQPVHSGYTYIIALHWNIQYKLANLTQLIYVVVPLSGVCVLHIVLHIFSGTQSFDFVFDFVLGYCNTVVFIHVF